MEYLTWALYKEIAEQIISNHNSYWKSYKRRWYYHKRAIDIIKRSTTKNPSKILEMGPMGITLVKGSDTIDCNESNYYDGQKPTYIFDARETPWPIDDKKYEWFIALRVFQHLDPVQKDCFHEALRIAKNVLIVVPDDYSLEKTGKGISLKQFRDWNNGKPPAYVEWTAKLSPLMHHYIYCWGEDLPAKKACEKIETFIHTASPLLSNFIHATLRCFYKGVRVAYWKYKGRV